VFHFKRFSVSHSQSTMKVGTDAVLIGAWLLVPQNCKNILEIGCGCGVISLMMAQRTNAKITGIDIDLPSVVEAQQNAENSPWKNRVIFIHEDVQNFVQNTTQQFDIIISNPPFFENSLKSPFNSKNISKHNVTLDFETLNKVVDKLLSKDGRFGVILPADAEQKFVEIAEKNHLFLTKKTDVYPTPQKKSNRVLMMFERTEKPCEYKRLLIRDKGYTVEYLQLVNEYLKIEN